MRREGERFSLPLASPRDGKFCREREREREREKREREREKEIERERVRGKEKRGHEKFPSQRKFPEREK